jgi:hypothetical protein
VKLKQIKVLAKPLILIAVLGGVGASLGGCVYYPDGGYGGYYAPPAYGVFSFGGGGYHHHGDDDDD